MKRKIVLILFLIQPPYFLIYKNTCLIFEFYYPVGHTGF